MSYLEVSVQLALHLLSAELGIHVALTRFGILENGLHFSGLSIGVVHVGGILLDVSPSEIGRGPNTLLQ